VARLFEDVFSNEDARTYRMALEVLDGQHAWLEEEVPDVAGAH
jgi:hypothetical protein